MTDLEFGALRSYETMEELLDDLDKERMVDEGGPVGPTDDDGQVEKPEEEEE